jgi:hypothetical protein
MAAVIKLQENIECGYLCSQIQKLIEQNQSTISIGESILVIDIKNIIDAPNPIPKLPYQE